jgi:hypothetical protein
MHGEMWHDDKRDKPIRSECNWRRKWINWSRPCCKQKKRSRRFRIDSQSRGKAIGQEGTGIEKQKEKMEGFDKEIA